MESPQTTWLDRIAILGKYRRFLLRWLFLWLIIGVIAFVVWPRKYRAESSFLPPVEENTGFFGALSASLKLGKVSDVEGSGFLAILRSNRLKDSLDVRYDFRKRYSVTKRDKAYKAFDNKMEVDREVEEGIGVNQVHAFYIRVTDKKAEDAAAIANDVIYFADKLTAELTTQRQRYTREFLEQRVTEAKESLRIAEDSLKIFSIRTGVILPTEQIGATIRALGEIETGITTSEVQLNVAKTTFGATHPNVKELEARLEELRRQRGGLSGTVDQRIQSSLLDLKQSPDFILEHTRRYREVISRTIISEFLEKQLEQARISELRNAPVLRVLDQAIAPETRRWPILSLMLLIGLIFGAFSGLLWIGWKEWVNEVQKTEYATQYQVVSKQFSLPALWRSFFGKD